MMGHTQSAALPSGSSGDESTRTLCCPDALQRVRAAFERLIEHPLKSETRAAFATAVDGLLPGDSQFATDLREMRQRQLARHGGYMQRYVLCKDVRPDGTVHPLPRRIPVRDDMYRKLARLVKSHPNSFPAGLQQLLSEERPLQQARSSDYAELIAATVCCELDSLLKCDRPRLLKSGATLLELADIYSHMRRIAGAHPKVVEIVDRQDAEAIIDFLVTLGARTPLSATEFERFVQMAAQGWQQAADQDVIVRGRVLISGLAGKAPLLKSWVEPFAAEVLARGWMSRLQTAYRQRQEKESATPAGPHVVRTAARPPAPQLQAAVESGKGGLTAVEPAVNLRDSDGFQVPIAVPEPTRLNVLRNYLRCASATTVIRLSEALRMSEAQADVPDHRVHVQRVLKEEGWAITGQSQGDPLFARLNVPERLSPGA